MRKLCRLLGFGLLGVFATGRVEVFVEPSPWKPRPDRKRRARLVREHRRRNGDPASGGMTKLPIMTAYRQQALLCAAMLQGGPCRTSQVKAAVPDGPKILLHNVYGWFDRVERGVYRADVGRRCGAGALAAAACFVIRHAVSARRCTAPRRRRCPCKPGARHL